MSKFFFFVFFSCIVSAQNIKTYKFNLYDGTADLFTMAQFNQNYLSSYRIISRGIDSVSISKSKRSNSFIKGFTKFTILLVGSVLTHEEGHRSILTYKGIGSISQSYYNSNGLAYVKGVSDITLKKLRDDDLPTYIRLHTAGLESDYALSTNIERLIVFNEDDYNTMREEFLYRKVAPILYNLTTLFPSLFPDDLTEEKNELDRDIVGHDIWGMVRNLHRPNDKFYRYTLFDDLTNVEQEYAKKIAWRSLINLVSPVIIGKANFNISDSFKGNFSLGHSLAPFGDYFDQNFYFIINNRYKIFAYIRENLNKDNAFMAGGISLNNFVISSKVSISSSIDLWSQPKGLSFTTHSNTYGGSANFEVNYNILNNKEAIIKNVGIFSNIFYKTRGFLPEQPSLDKDLRIRIGLYLSY